jgi:hypothetical protein
MVNRYPDSKPRPIRPWVATERVDDVVIDSPGARNARVYRLQQALYLLFGVIETLIAIRLILRLFGANPEAPFAAAMYAITAPLIAPFVGLFGTPQLGRSVFEPHSIVALCIYALLAWLLGSVIWLLLGDARADAATTRRTVEHTEQVNDRDLAA